MNCELAHQSIVMAAYGELPDDAAHELERHLAACQECAHQRDQVQALKLLAGTIPVQEPDPNLIARSRIRLEEALDALPPKRWLERLVEKLRNNAAGLQAAPVAACLLLLVGAGAGSLGGYHIAQARAARVEQTRAADAPLHNAVLPDAASGAEIANVSSIVRQPNSEYVEVHYNQLVPQQVRGSLDDPEIRQLLMLAIESAGSAGVRDDSVGLLAAECRAGHGCQGAGIRDALMAALRYDRNAGVRQKALEGLQPYVAQDLRVRDAVLEALLNDSDPRIRTEAINILEPVEADTSVRQVLRSVASSDRNPRIRLVSRQVLNQVGEIQ
ncbi:MAG: HEAT repeat domain-containing protein [Terracidiphilus sp.]